MSWELSSDNVDQYLLQTSTDNYKYREYFTKTTDHTRLEGFRPGSQFSLSLSALVGSGDMRQEGVVNNLSARIGTVKRILTLPGHLMLESTQVVYRLPAANAPLEKRVHLFLTLISYFVSNLDIVEV